MPVRGVESRSVNFNCSTQRPTASGQDIPPARNGEAKYCLRKSENPTIKPISVRWTSCKSRVENISNAMKHVCQCESTQSRFGIEHRSTAYACLNLKESLRGELQGESLTRSLSTGNSCSLPFIHKPQASGLRLMDFVSRQPRRTTFRASSNIIIIVIARLILTIAVHHYRKSERRPRTAADHPCMLQQY